MSQPDEPSYYEIALTNRQVVVAFVILLGCLLAAFFSGVWIGKGHLPVVQQAVVSTPPVNATVEAGGKAEPLDFFEDIQAKGSDAATGPKPRPRPGTEPAPAPIAEAGPPADRTAPKSMLDRGEEEGTAGTATPAPGQGAGAPAGAAMPAPEGVGPASDHAKNPAAERRAANRARREAAKAQRSRVAGGDPEPAAGSVIIQVFASPAREEAIKVRNRLRAGSQKAYLSPSTVKGKTLYRVRIGPFGSREAAQATADKVRRAYKLDTWVTQ